MDLIKLFEYVNGNYKVEILSDGTKIRTYNGNPIPEFPESIDIKITNFCDLESVCVYCHEKSNKNGKHADFEILRKLSNECPKGVEWAIGGGNPLSHPNLIELLELNKKNDIISNITVNQLHIKRYIDLIKLLIERKLIYGLGISYRKNYNIPNEILILNSISQNIVWHLILGEDNEYDIDKLIDFNSKNIISKLKLLFLGYKNFGKGKSYLKINNEKIESSISNLRRRWIKYSENENLLLNFDNLAIQQLELKKWIFPEHWNQIFMGNDGEFSMYIDCVKKQFSKNSSSEIHFDISNLSFKEMFHGI